MTCLARRSQASRIKPLKGTPSIDPREEDCLRVRPLVPLGPVLYRPLERHFDAHPSLFEDSRVEAELVVCDEQDRGPPGHQGLHVVERLDHALGVFALRALSFALRLWPYLERIFPLYPEQLVRVAVLLVVVY